jgi:hypothetical protein
MSDHATLPARYDHVGSFLRPQHLLDARAQRVRGGTTTDQLRAVEDKAISVNMAHGDRCNAAAKKLANRNHEVRRGGHQRCRENTSLLAQASNGSPT